MKSMEGDIMNFHLDPWLFQPKGDDFSFNASISACEKSTQWNQVPRSEGERGAKWVEFWMDKMTKGVWLLNKYWEFPKSQTWNLSCSMEELVGHSERCQCNLRQAIFVHDLAFCDRDTKQESMKQFGYVCKLPCQKTCVVGHFFCCLYSV